MYLKECSECSIDVIRYVVCCVIQLYRVLASFHI
jgi:hypothetical protein